MRVSCVRDRDSFLKLRKEWNSLLETASFRSVFLTHEWFWSWWNTLGEREKLEIYLIRDDKDELLGIAPLLKQDQRLIFLASQEVTDYCDFICRKGHEKIVIDLILDHLTQNQMNIAGLDLINIQESSPTLRWISEKALNERLFCKVQDSEVTPGLDLPPTYEDYLSLLTRKQRHELKRKIRRFENTGTPEIRSFHAPSEMKPALNSFFHLHKKSSQDKLRFWQTPGMEDYFKLMCADLSRSGWIRITLLLRDKAPVASLLTFDFDDSVSFYNIGYDPEFSAFSPGFFLFHYAIKQAIHDQKKKIDFLRGREKYKYDFGAKNSKIFNLTLNLRANQT